MFKLRKYSTFLYLNNQMLLFTLYICLAYNVHHVDTLAETEHVSLSHLQLAHNMREEAKKLEDFREKQKETRKKVGCFIGVAVTLHFTTHSFVNSV